MKIILIMNIRIVMAALAAASATSLAAQIASSSPQGWIDRAQLMLDDGNYAGCIDQLSRARAMSLDPAQAEHAAFLLGAATVHADNAYAAQLLTAFLADYPASELRYEALMALGDCYYGTSLSESPWAEALKIYDQINPKALPADKAQTLAYRKGICLLSLGNLDQAAAQMRTLASSKRFAKAADFYLGYIEYSHRRYAQALPLFEKARSNADPGRMADYYLCQIHYMKGDLRQALAEAKSLLARKDIGPDYIAEANRVAGECAFRLGDASQARKYLQAYSRMVAEMQPSASYILGLMAYEEGDYDSAINLMKPATETGDAMAQSAYLYLGQAMLKTGNTDGAIMAFDKAINMDFDRAVQENAYYNYAVAAMQGGKVPFGNAVATFEAFLRRYPDSPYAPAAQANVVDAYLGSNDYEAALASFEAMPNPTPETRRAMAHVLYRLGARDLAAGNHARAIERLDRAAAMRADAPDVAREAMLPLAQAYYAASQPDRALAKLDAYIDARGSNTPLARFERGYALMAQKKYSPAIAEFEAAGADRALDAETRADALCRLGDCRFYLGDFAPASQAYDKALSLNPRAGDYPLMQKALMEGYLRHHRQKIALLEQLQEQYPESPLVPDALLETTESCIQLGDNDAAIAAYRTLVDKYPLTAQGRQGWLQMALTLLNCGRKAEAIDAYKHVVTTYPTSDEAVLAADQLKRIYADDGRIAEYAAFINSVPTAPKMDASEADNLAFDAAEKQYITADATALLEQYLADFPDGAHRAKALACLAEDAAARGDDKAAYAYACELAEQYPDNEAAVSALAIKARIEQAEGKGALALRTWLALRSKAHDPENINLANKGIMQCAAAVGDNATAAAAADELLASTSAGDDTRREALYRKGRALADSGSYDQAREAWRKAAAAPSDYYGMAAAYSIAESHMQQGALDKAEAAAKQATEADTPHDYWVARAFILLSDIYRRQGDEFKATQYLKSLRDNYPGSEAEIFEMIDQRLK